MNILDDMAASNLHAGSQYALVLMSGVAQPLLDT